MTQAPTYTQAYVYGRHTHTQRYKLLLLCTTDYYYYYYYVRTTYYGTITTTACRLFLEWLLHCRHLKVFHGHTYTQAYGYTTGILRYTGIRNTQAWMYTQAYVLGRKPDYAYTCAFPHTQWHTHTQAYVWHRHLRIHRRGTAYTGIRIVHESYAYTMCIRIHSAYVYYAGSWRYGCRHTHCTCDTWILHGATTIGD